jgi:predicted dehydrogenase
MLGFSTMKQIIQSMSSGETKLIEVPAPGPSPGSVLVRTAASLVSPGTERAVAEFAAKGMIGKAQARPDLVHEVWTKLRREGPLATLEAVQNRLRDPLPLGYSSAGTVEKLGESVTDLAVGQRVACGGGGYAVHAEIVSVPRLLVAPVPDSVSDEAAAFATLGAVALHGFRLAEVEIGERVAVIGLGLLGQLALRLIDAAGCRPFGIDISRDRVDFAREAGYSACERVEADTASGDWTAGFGFDAILICAESEDSDPVELAGAIARDRASVVAVGAVGMEIPRRLYYEKELTFKVSRSYGPGRYDPGYEEKGIDYPAGYVRWTEGRNLEAFLGLVAEGRVDPQPLITHRFPIEQAETAYELIRGPKSRSALGIILEYPEREGFVRELRLAPARHDVKRGSVRVGVLGSGNYARSTFLPRTRGVAGVDWVGLASARGLSSAQAARRFGFEYATSDGQALVDDESIDAIAVLTRHHLHAANVEAALGAGKHVFCEKPLALNHEELARIRVAMATAQRLLAVGFNRRFAPMLIAMRDHFGDAVGPLTMIYRVNAGRLPAGHWLNDPKVGGGRIVGEVCHFIDAMAYLSGSLPVSVFAQGVHASEANDNVNLTLSFSDGSVGSILYTAEGDRSQPKERFEAFGGGKSSVLDDFRRLDTYRGGRRRGQRSWLRQDKGHRALWRAFIESIRQGGPPPTSYEEIFYVTSATFAAIDSLQSGRPEAVLIPESQG